MFQRCAMVRMVAGGLTIVVLAACGGGSGESQSGSDDDKASSPMAELFGWDESPAESRRKQLESEEIVALCMKELGWEYTPVDYSTADFGGGEDQDLTPEEYGEKYAYGITRGYELYELPGLSGEPAEGDGLDDPTVDGPGFVDPNQDYVTSLDQIDQEQYYEDLYGNQDGGPTEVDEATGETIYLPPPPEQRGCSGRAQLEVYGASPFEDPEISSRMEDLGTAMTDDPRLKDANIKWAECLADADASFEIKSPDETYGFLEKLKAEMAGQEIVPLNANGEPESGAEDIYSSVQNADGSGWAIIGQPTALSEADLEKLRTQEMELWQADQKCQKKAGLVKLRTTIEQELVDQLLEDFPELAKS